jgi:glycosyltransferase involved in cell wall biosynthesis
VTVVIPTYNRAVLLKKAISSVLSQTYSNFELVIADDGSTDDTAGIFSAIKDKRIRYLPLSHTGHLGKVRNAGAFAGKGEWIAFLDADDTWLPGKLEKQFALVKSSGRRWCYSGFVHVDELGNVIPPRAGAFHPCSGNITASLLKNDATVVICTVLVERKLFEETGGFSTDERLKLRGDYELALRLSVLAEAIASPEILVRVLEHANRVTHSVPDPFERSAMPYRLFLEYANDPLLRKIATQRLAYLLSEAAVRRSAAGQHRKAIRHLRHAAGRDNYRHWLSAVYRSVKATFARKHYQPVSNKP